MIETRTNTSDSPQAAYIWSEKDKGKAEFDLETLQTLSTCRPDYENNPDFVNCFECDSKNEPACNFRPSKSSSTMWCNIKKKKCFSKAVYKSPKNLLESFVRGCSTVKDFVGSNILIGSKKNESEIHKNIFCYHNSNLTKACIIFCNTSLCNKEVTGRANSRVVTVKQIQPEASKLESNHCTQNQKSLFLILLKIILVQIYFF